MQVESNNFRIDVDADIHRSRFAPGVEAEEDTEEESKESLINHVNLDVKADRFSPRGKEKKRKDKHGKRGKRVPRLNAGEDEDTTDDDEEE